MSISDGICVWLLFIRISREQRRHGPLTKASSATGYTPCFCMAVPARPNPKRVFFQTDVFYDLPPIQKFVRITGKSGESEYLDQ